MYAFATWTGGDNYDVLVWSSEAESINDDGARAIARKTVTVDPADISGSIRAEMDFTEDDEVELN